MKKRLALACSLIVNPKLLILDEPTSGIDPESLDIVRNLLKKINDTGTTIIFSSHDLNTVEKLCTNIAIIDNGSLIYNGELNYNTSSLEQFYLELTTKNYEFE
ncbi:AAA domain-containing protein, putative AbiEii toxin, Type IV TA system [Clostridium grantii DSM 8605]|uniref:AAA domain-containing protein, putative AbiEii toxin, Type IV TA system n=1 Tax=Clostridium grantii DSM 8605 TaxID=1121316 RepID=A0A1M5WTD6_9CLOT|nr:AAA domain-containing protein, putative AbiEii toxin, Type IV TA system [Clostridium grantii DSM 8605]